MSDRLKNLARRFSVRTERMKEKVVQPATPESEKRSIDDEATSGMGSGNESEIFNVVLALV